MKVLFLADTQIGVQTVDLADQQAVLERIVQVALDRQVDVVVHGGDVFEGPTVTPEHLRVFLDATARLYPQIPLLLLRGNGRHDSAVRSVHALDVLREVPGITVVDRPQSLLLAGIWFVPLPWVHPGRLIAEMALNINVDHDEVNTLASRMLAEIAADLYPEDDPDKRRPKVLVAHWAISGSALPSGLSADEMREPVLPWADLDALGYDLIVAGHIHAAQRLDNQQIDRTPGFVVGSPQQLNHGEHGEHGVWVVDFGAGVPERSPRAGREGADSAGGPSAGADGSAPSIEFVPIPSRKFVTFSYDFTEDADLSYFVEESDWGGADDPPVAGAIVRVRYQATEEQARQIDQARIRRALMDAGAARVTFKPEIVRQARARSERMTDQLGPVEALATYCEAQEIGDPLRARMLSRLEEWIAA